MDNHREFLTDNYLPFSVLSVGVIPIQVSAFMYGLFVGKSLEKHKLKIKPTITKVDKNTILKDIERSMNYYNGLMGGYNKSKSKETKDNDTTEQKP
jgi:hypothetical protein